MLIVRIPAIVWGPGLLIAQLCSMHSVFNWESVCLFMVIMCDDVGALACANHVTVMVDGWCCTYRMVHDGFKAQQAYVETLLCECNR